MLALAPSGGCVAVAGIAVVGGDSRDRPRGRTRPSFEPCEEKRQIADAARTHAVIYRRLADLVVAVHALIVVFFLCGGLLSWRHP
jgi:hypothetical protein